MGTTEEELYSNNWALAPIGCSFHLLCDQNSTDDMTEVSVAQNLVPLSLVQVSLIVKNVYAWAMLPGRDVGSPVQWKFF